MYVYIHSIYIHYIYTLYIYIYNIYIYTYTYIHIEAVYIYIYTWILKWQPPNLRSRRGEMLSLNSCKNDSLPIFEGGRYPEWVIFMGNMINGFRAINCTFSAYFLMGESCIFIPHFLRFNRRKRTADLSCLAKTSLGCYHHCCQRCRRLTIIDVRLPSLLPSLNHLVDHWDFQMDQPGATFSGFARYPQHPWRIWQLKGLVAQGRLGRSECFPWKVTCNLQTWLWAMIFISKMEILGPCSAFYLHYPLSLSLSLPPSLSLSLASSGNSSNPAALRIRSIPRLGVSQKWPSVKSLSFAFCEVHAMAAMVKTWRCIPSPWVIINPLGLKDSQPWFPWNGMTSSIGGRGEVARCYRLVGSRRLATWWLSSSQAVKFLESTGGFWPIGWCFVFNSTMYYVPAGRLNDTGTRRTNW